MFEMQDEIKKSRHEDGMNMVKLGDIATYVNGYAFKPDDRGDYGLPIIRIQDLTGNTYDLGFYDGDYPKKIEINNGDILISWSASLGVYEWKRGKALLNQHIFKVVFDKEVDVSKKYFVYAVKYKLEELSRKSHGATMKHVIKKDFDNTKIPFPSFVRQKEIAERLEKTSKIISGRKKQLQKLDELIQARFVEMFGDPISNSLESNMLPMTDVCEIIDGDRGKNYPTQEEFNEKGYCLFLNAKNVTNVGFNFDKCMFITKQKDEILRKGKLCRGDVVLTTRGTIGNMAYYTEKIPFEHIRINSGMVILRMKHEIINEVFFIEQFKMQIANIKSKIASGSAQPQLPISTMNRIHILIPDINSQNQFADFVNQVNKSKVEIQQALEKTQLLFDSLMQQYFG